MRRRKRKRNVCLSLLCIVLLLVSCGGEEDKGQETADSKMVETEEIGKQESEIQKPETQESETQESETQESETQESETQEPGIQEPESQEPGTQEAEGTDPVSNTESSDPSDSATTETASSAQSEISGEISVVSLNRQDGYIKRLSLEFDKANPKCTVTYENMYQNRDRVLAEILNGQGPDLLCIRDSDIEKLYKNGALGEMGTLLSEDILGNIFTPALELGTIDGKLYSLPTTVYIQCMAVNREVYDGDAWTIQDVVSIIKEHPEFERMFCRGDGFGDWDFNLRFLLQDVEHSSFVADGKSHFNTPEFREILTLIKEKSGSLKWDYDPELSTAEEVVLALKEGKCLAAEVDVVSINEFGKYVTSGLGSSGVDFIGYPAEDGNGIWMVPNEMVIVNQASMEKPGIRELVEYIYCLESQQSLWMSSGISIRRDVLEGKIHYFEYNDQYVYNEGGSRGMVLLPGKGKDNFYLDEFLEFVENSTPGPSEWGEMLEIIADDCGPYFKTRKSMDEVLDSIDRRVNLYLSDQGAL